MKWLWNRLWLLILSLLIVAGCSAPSAEKTEGPPAAAEAESTTEIGAPTGSVAKDEARYQSSAKSSERLGTQWGEGIGSNVTTVDLRRVSSNPVEMMQISYSAARQTGRQVQEAMIANGRIGVAVLNERNSKWAMTQNGKNFYLKGAKGQRYQLFYRNYSNKTYEIVATVDGLDVINGSAGSISNAGYVLYPNSTLTIEGFRKSSSEVAAFRFAAAEDAYAANTPAGSIKNTGVIGTAVFELYDPNKRTVTPKPRTDTPKAFPADEKGFAPPPVYGN